MDGDRCTWQMSEAASASSRIGLGAGITRVLSDEALARRAAKEDGQAFAAIFRRYHQSLYRFCLAIVGNSEDAQDALQNTMVKVLRALPGEERQIELKPWLYRIAHNESIDLLRRRRETRQVDPELAAPGSGLAEEAAVRERLRRLIADLEELPERQRGTLVMRELAGLDFAEIGAALGTSAAVARQTLYEARLSLRQMDEGREMNCALVTKALSDGDGRVTRRRDVRAHLRICASCRHFRDEIGGRQRDFAALSPLPAMAAAGLLQGLLGGGGGGAGGGGLAAALGGGAAKSVGASAVLKGAATVALVGALGVGVADRSGLIDVGLPGAGGSETSEIQRSLGVDQQRLRLARVIGAPGAGSRAGVPAGVNSGGEAEAAPGGGNEARAEASPKTPATTGAAASPDGGATNPVEVQGDAAVDGDKTNAAAGTAEPPVEGSGESSPPTQGGEKGSSGTAPKGKAKGKGHAKDLPSASEHGQQTAAANKGAEHGSSGSPKGQAESPPSAENAPPPSPPGVPASPPGQSAGGTPPGQEKTPPGQEKEKIKKSQALP
jgi:RNA polymerase sigma factor (sigma-70 family)